MHFAFRYVADAAASANALALYSTSTKAPALCTKLLHRYLSAVDVELSVEFGGTEDQRILVMQVKCLADSMSMMVADHRGRIAFVTSKLCQMLGYSVKTLTNMDLQAILPPPFAQLHVGWMKVIAQGSWNNKAVDEPPATWSCLHIQSGSAMLQSTALLCFQHGSTALPSPWCMYCIKLSSTVRCRTYLASPLLPAVVLVL